MSASKEATKSAILKYQNLPFNIYEKSFGSYKAYINNAADHLNITLKSLKGKKISYLYYGNKKIGTMTGLKPPSTGKIASTLCNDKFRMENYLRKLEIPVLRSEHFFNKENAFEFLHKDEAVSYVLKPLSLAGGDGIELNVQTDTFSNAWDNSLKVQKEKNVTNPSCIIQPYINGFDVRISIIEGRFNSALLRLPANITGDGKQTINQLIQQKNEYRTTIPYYRKKLINVNDQLVDRLALEELNLDSVPNNKEVIVLNDISNLTLGGESVDITNEVSEDIINAAVEAVASVPQLYTAGIDFMCEDFTEGLGHIIEINTNANHTMHHVPVKGEAHEPFDALIESILIKYKVRNGIALTEDEALIYKDIVKFIDLKSKITSNIFQFTDL
ncbi:ATP-grasp domain-containing protein [Salinicoccus albus]|uniref:ATP-grasp domain-containing protein n=1 Tax=Salinicoccus albus TaxID=418756 RepID=UPI00037B6A9C|nr:ATP-grasp domain-containing protein [Salinicoccus albus]